MNDEWIAPGWERKIKEVASEKLQIPAPGQMRRLVFESLRVSGENHRTGSQPQTVIGVGEALQKPYAEKTGAACDKKRLAANLFPQPAGLSKDIGQVFWRKRRT